MSDETRREDVSTVDEATDAGTGGTRTTTGVDDAFVKVPDVESDDANRSRAADEDRDSLVEADKARGYRQRWEAIQADFVDRPRESVEQADGLVIEVVQQLQASFTLERDRLESQWRDGSDVSTEDLRVALQRYRSFFDRLLST